jgi:apolipoprotein N-acyltransferase
LIAANTGFSAWIDSGGRIVARGPRSKKGVVVAEARLDSRSSWYLDHGDWLAGVCLASCIALAAAGGYFRWTERRRAVPPA